MPIDAGNVVIGSDVVFDGSGSWSLSRDLELAGDRDLLLEGDPGDQWRPHDGAQHPEDRTRAPACRDRFLGAPASGGPAAGADVRADMGNALQLVNGTPVPMATTMADGPERGITVCGTGPTDPVRGGRPAGVRLQRFGVAAKACDGVVTATVTGVLVRSPTNGWEVPPRRPGTMCAQQPTRSSPTRVSCAATVNVSDPALLSAIFGVVLPACADVSATGRHKGSPWVVPELQLPVERRSGNRTGGLQLCAGPNTLEVTDANNCLFDTTFFLNVTPIEPNLSFTDATCFGGCDGTADVAPVGGTMCPFLWAPAPPSGQGTHLCFRGFAQALDGDRDRWERLRHFTVAFTINEPAPIRPNPSQVDASCGMSAMVRRRWALPVRLVLSAISGPAPCRPGYGTGHTALCGNVERDDHR